MNAISSFSSQLEAKIPHQIAFIYAFISQTSFVFGHTVVQTLSKSITPVQILYFAGLQVAIVNYFVLKSQGLSTYGKTPKLNKMLLFRGFFGFGGAIFVNTGLSYMPLSESIVLQMTVPVFTGILAYFFLNEKYDRTLVTSTIFSFFGVVLISKPSFIFGEESDKDAAAYPNRSLGVLFTIIGSFFGAAIQITLKKLGAVSNANTTGFYWGIGLTISGPFFQVFKGVKPFYFGLVIWLLLLGLSRYISQIYMHKSFTLGEANKVSLIAYFQVPMAYIVDVLILGVAVDIYSVVGSICVFSCVFLMLYKNYKDNKEKTAQMMIKTAAAAP